jgi:hypothetical protein
MIVRQFFIDQREAARPRRTSHALKWLVQRERSAKGDAVKQRRIEEGRHEVTSQDTRPRAWG